jgi:pyrroloquinoline quinone biosynthesis protein B
MRILVLGSAAGGGSPQWNCNCAVCARVRRGEAPERTQSSLAVNAGGGWVLLNASPDLRHQINSNPALRPHQPGRASPLSAVLLTNADVDHVAGLLTLRERQSLALYATARVGAVLQANAVFNVLDPDLVERRALSLDTPVALSGRDGEPTGLTALAFAVPGKVALYLEDASAGPNFGSTGEDTIAVEITEDATGRRFFYIPGCAAMPDWLSRRLAGAELVLFDGTLWQDDEMIAAGLGEKSGLRMGHMCMSGLDGSMAALADLDIARKIYVHINNTNPALLPDSPERRAAEAAGWQIAHDGLEIAL